METDNLTDKQFAEMVEAQCSPAAKRIAELEQQLLESERMRDHHAACCRDYLARNAQLERELDMLLMGTNDRLTWQYWRDRARVAEGNSLLPNPILSEPNP